MSIESVRVELRHRESQVAWYQTRVAVHKEAGMDAAYYEAGLAKETALRDAAQRLLDKLKAAEAEGGAQ